MTTKRRSNESDRTLMKLVKRGDARAYATLFSRHHEQIGRVAYLLLHDAAAAEDAIQETFTRGLARIETFRGESEPGGWFYVIALNVCRRALRDRRTHAGLTTTSKLDLGRRIGPPKRGVVTSVLRRETARRLTIAMGYLTEPQREVFALHYVENLSYDGIAKILKISPGAARALGFRARQVLQDKIGKMPPVR